MLSILTATQSKPIRPLFVKPLLSTIFLIGIVMGWGNGAWIMAKAYLAQYLIKHAWQITLITGVNTKPWPWADTWPVARLRVPDLDIDWIVLSGAQGASLAFSPGHISNTALPMNLPASSEGHYIAASKHIVISGHRDTHFEFLQDLKAEHSIFLQGSSGHWRSYTVQSTEVKNITNGPWLIDKYQDQLTLITCYPFDALTPGGPQRFLVQAIPNYKSVLPHSKNI